MTTSRPFELAVGGVTLSGLLAEPDGAPRGLVVALHGHGMTARYFAGPTDAALSLLDVGAALGFTVWAPDRPGYGASAGIDQAQLPMFPQAALLTAAIGRFCAEHDPGAGCVIIGHSFGLKLALTIASSPGDLLLVGVEGSGTGLRYAFEAGVSPPTACEGDVNPSWGPGHLYPPGTFDRDVLPAAKLPFVPRNELVEWTDDLRGFADRIRVPVRFTFGDHDRLWEVSEEHFAELHTLLPSAPWVVVEVQQGAGHNVSLSHAARAYHLKALAFAEECLGAHRPAGDGAERRTA